MDVHDRLAAVKLGHHRLMGRMAQPRIAVAGHEMRAVAFERIEGVFDLSKRRVNIRERQGAE